MNLLPQYDTKLFTDIYEKVDDFVADYNEINLGGLTDSTLVTKLFYLLYARFGNSPIANLDENQFKYKLFSTVFMYGPAWESRLDIQGRVRNLLSNPLDETELLQGAKAVHNHAYNPATDPTTQTTTELNYINEQHVDKFGKTNTMSGSVSNTNTQTNNLATSDQITKGILDGYSELWDILVSDVTEDFLAKFKPLFKKFVSPFTELYEGED